MANSTDSDSESKLISLISQIVALDDGKDTDMDSNSDSEWDSDLEWESKIISLIIQTISLVISMDLNSQPKPESKLMSLTTQTVSLFKSMDFASLPKPLLKVISLFSKEINRGSDQKLESDLRLPSLVGQTLRHKPEPELILLIRQIASLHRRLSEFKSE
ncbi:unnamed protein product [Microthlaspi erraticum]|uniref:Uncharacterized protein n=1 Tax=Microthlaspi erraticum TaxID=1685480 RepID=A0A6D2ID21_9BRAS|nr:unnamed protein product [Microthlaspi erraticum]